jgi:hypothetical protein
MRKSAYFVLTIIAALTTLFMWRQRNLNALRASNDSLRRTCDQEELRRSDEVSEPSTNSLARLSEPDEKELLQLRSRIVSLREQARDESNRLAVIQEVKRSGVSRQTATRTALAAGLKLQNYQDARRLGQAVGVYLFGHGTWRNEERVSLPGDIASMLKQLDGATGYFTPDSTAQFELMGTNVIPADLKDFSLVAREKEAEQLMDGRWLRIYILANGAVRVAGPFQTPDWTGFESHFTESEKSGRTN